MLPRVAGGYSWSDMRERGTYRLPGPDNLGWWAAIALLCSILLHVVAFLLLGYYKVDLGFSEAGDMSTAPVRIQQVIETEMPAAETAPPDTSVTPPPDAARLLEEIDLLDKLPKNQEIEMKPDVLTPEYAIKMTAPAAEGSPAAAPAPDIAGSGLDFETKLPDLGHAPEKLPPAAAGQLIVDPGAVQADDKELESFTNSLVRKGANGKVRGGALDGVASLDDLIGLPPNALLGKKTMLPSDLLFEFNSDELRESAKVGLMKLGLLIDRNPELYCWVEGHTDAIGSDAANLDLSRRRAAAVRNYLVGAMRMDGAKISARGKGESELIVADGTADEQAPNRRVEIRMRKEPPPPEAVAPPRAPEATRTAAPARALPAEPEPETPRATPVAEEHPAETPPRALPLEDSPPPRAQPVEESAPPRAEPIEE